MWKCRFASSGIKVFVGNNIQGEYSLIQEPYCRKCACPNVTTDSCNWHWRTYGFERTFTMGLYYPSRGEPSSIGWSDLLSKHIRGVKMFPRYAVPLGLGLSLCIKNKYMELQSMDLIVPVPKFTTELKQSRNGSGKTYNQTAEISKVISEKTGITYTEALEKTEEKKMRPLSLDERWEAVKGLYKLCNKETIEGKKIILIDDVFTSGATVSECSDILVSAGAECVNVLVAGRDTG